MGDRPAAIAVARQIAAFGAPGVRMPQTRRIADRAWEMLLSVILEERITGLALESVAQGWLDLTDEQTDRLYAAHRNTMTWNLHVERKLVAVAEAFDRAGIPFAVLKGASVARTFYADPCLRSFADLDLLVLSEDYERACALLDGSGHVRQRPEPRPGFEVRFGKGSVHRDPNDAIEVDLHRTLVLGAFGLWIDPGELLHRRTTFDIGGRSVGRLDDTGMLLNVAMHASLGRSEARLVPLRDVAQVANGGRIDWDVLSGWGRRWHMAAVLQDAFATASSTLGASMPEEARAFVERATPRSDVRTLQAYKGERRSLGGTSLTTLRAIPGIANKATYVWDLAVPDREFLQARANGSRSATYRRRWSIAARWVSARLPWRRTAGWGDGSSAPGRAHASTRRSS